jgi:hypothetical protein
LAIIKPDGYSEGVTQNDFHAWLYNAFGVNEWFIMLSQGAPLDRLGATLGYGL